MMVTVIANRKFEYKATLAENSFPVSMEPQYKEKPHQLINMPASLIWEITKTRHLLPGTVIQTIMLVVLLPKYLIMKIASGSKFRTTHFPPVISKYDERYLRFSKQTQEKTHEFIFRISHYATTHTDEGVYILGGWMGPAGRSYTIAEYKDDAWNNAGRMWKRRYAHDALTLGSTAIIFSHEDTDKMELLDLETFEHELIDISASPVNTKLGMFLVPNGYCSAGN